AVVDVRVVDQSFPAHGCARFLEVGAHNDDKGIVVLVPPLQQTVAVLEGGIRIMDRARSDNNQETVVIALDYGDCFPSALEHCLPRIFGLRNLMLQKVRRGEWVVSAYCKTQVRKRAPRYEIKVGEQSNVLRESS